MKSKLETKDIIFIKQLVVPALIGVLPEERKSPQNLTIDLEMSVDIRDAASDDDLHRTVDYAAVRHSIIEFIAASAYELIETLVDRLASHLLSHFTIASVRLSVTKRPFDISDAEGVGIVVIRDA